MAFKFGFAFVGLLCLVSSLFAAPPPPFPNFSGPPPSFPNFSGPPPPFPNFPGPPSSIPNFSGPPPSSPNFSGPPPAFPNFPGNSGPMKGLFERMKLANMAMTEFQSVHSKILEESPKVFSNVLKDPKVVRVRTGSMAQYKTLLKDYIDQAEQASESSPDAAFDIVEKYEKIVEKFDKKKQGNLSREAAIIERSLKENGLEEIQREYKAKFEGFVVKVNSEVDEYLKGLNETEKDNEKDLIDWHRSLNTEQDVDEKIKILKNLPKPNFG